MVLPIAAEPLSPRHRQRVAGAIEDGVAEHGDPSIHGRVSLREPADVDLERHEVTDHVVALRHSGALLLRWPPSSTTTHRIA